MNWVHDVRVTVRPHALDFRVREGSDLLVKGVQMFYGAFEFQARTR